MRPFFLALSLFWTVFCFCDEPIAVYLTWQKDPTCTMTIQWISKIAEENQEAKQEANKDAAKEKEEKTAIVDTIEFEPCEKGAEEGVKAWKKVVGTHHSLPENGPFLVHVVKLEELLPKTSYRFRIQGEAKEYLFQTMPKTLSEPIVFVAGGDTNQAGAAAFEETNRQAAKENPAFALFGGDLAYASPNEKEKPDNREKWLHWLSSYSKTMITPKGYLIPLLVTIGNHDVKGHYEGSPKDAPFFYSLFEMPGLPGYNVLRFGNYFSLYLLDSDHTNRVNGAQTEWLKRELSKEKSTHRFAIYHVPAFPSVRSFHMKVSASIRRHWVPLFEKYRLNIALENNDHAYKRTYPLIDREVDPRGVVYIGDGSWGVKPRTPKKPKHVDYLAKTKAVRQFLKIELSESKREIWSLTEKGELVDHYIQFVHR